MAAYGLVPVLRELGEDLHCIEIGVCWGFNSYMLLESCPNIALITGIDHYRAYKDWDREIHQHEQDRSFEKIKVNMEIMGPRFNLIRESSTDAAAEIDDESCDFVFIDADHSMKAVLNDLDCYYPKVRKGGIVAGHDSNLFGVNFAVTSWVKRHGIDPADIKTVANDAWWFTKQ